jgi:hypothetical protein
MTSRRSMVMLCALSLTALLVGTRADAQTEQTGTQFYMAYRAAFAKAAKVEELFPFMGTAQRAQVEKTPAAERPEMFKMIKAFNTFTNVKVTQETKSATGATLEVEGLSEDKKKATATVELIREGGAWKIGKESWKQ